MNKYARSNSFATPSCHSIISHRGFQSSCRLLNGNTAAEEARPPRSSLRKHLNLLEDPPGELVDIQVAGLVRSIRKQKRAAFAHISDGTTLAPIQAVLSPNQAENIHNGSYVELQGAWSDSPGTGQAKELHAHSVLTVTPGEPEVSPIQKKSQTLEYLRSVPHLRMRTPLYSLLARVRSHVIQSAHTYHDVSRDCAAIFVQPPLITSSDCEGAGEVFTINPKLQRQIRRSDEAAPARTEDYFGEPKYLTVSGQLHLEAYAAELGDVWTLSPTFRAEESDTSRHLSEFYMLETEYRSITSLEELTTHARDLVKHLIGSLSSHRLGAELLNYYSDAKYVKENQSGQIDLEQRWAAVVSSPFSQITYDIAWSELDKAAEANPQMFKFKPDYEKGLQLEHERWVVENLGQNRPIFITHYPQHIKPFYMLPSSTIGYYGDGLSSSSGEYAACFDLLMPYGTCELIGGSLREHDLHRLIAQMRRHNLLKKTDQNLAADYPGLENGESLGNLRWYTDLRRFGTSKHGGFGLGFDRLLSYATGVASVKDVVGFPRWWGRADC